MANYIKEKLFCISTTLGDILKSIIDILTDKKER